MKLFPLLARPRVATATVLAVLSSSLVFAAVQADGYKATSVDLNDGSVWLYRVDKGWVAKANSQTAEIELATPVPQAQLISDGRTQLTLGAEGLRGIDVRTGLGTTAQPLPSGSVVGAGGGVSYLHDRVDGAVYVFPGGGVSGWEQGAEPTVEPSPESRVVATERGVVLVADPTAGGVVEVTSLTGESGVVTFEARPPTPMQLPSGDNWALTAVGETPVALGDGVLYGPAFDPIQLGNGSWRLQEPGPSRDDVVVAGDSGLYAFDLSTGERTELTAAGTGQPAAPLVHNGCVYSAWSGSPTWFEQCSGSTPVVDTVPNVAAGSALMFRHNRDALALSSDGEWHFIVRESRLIPIENWDQARPDDKDNEEEQRETREQTDEEERTCDDQQAPPVGPGGPLEFGARAGSTVVLDVLGFFNDLNCDPLAIREATIAAGPASATISIINFGQSLQLKAPGEASSITVDFTVDDGRAEPIAASAIVSVTQGQGTPPTLRNPDKEIRTTVQVGKTVTYNVLVDWIDAEGDVLSLESAALPTQAGDGRVVPSADGLITYTAENTTPGNKTIDYTVTDGVNAATGSLVVVVQPEGTQLRPVARDDYAVGGVNEPIKVLPLLNDTDGNGDPLTASPLMPAEYNGVLQLDASASEGAFIFTATQAGTYIVPYTAADTDSQLSRAAVRIEVVDRGSENTLPVAVRDSVVVREGRSVNVAVLANDSDADGDLLAVIDATLPVSIPQSVARVVVIDRQYVRVEVFKRPDQPLYVEYKISDGRSNPVAGQMVVTVPATTVQQFPLVNDDKATVRVNEVVSVDVLANDRDPDGDQLLFIPKPDGSPSVQIADGDGIVWLEGTTVRFKAGPTPTGARPVIITYDVDDDPLLSGLHRTTGTLQIRVLDDDKPLPPQPEPLSLRVFTNSRGTVRIPLTGIDDNGDTAILSQALKSQPSDLGVARVEGDTIVFEAGEQPGAGTIEYIVKDRFGYEGIGIVRLVVVEGAPFPPVPLNDLLRVRPSRDVAVNVLSNDTDPNGDELTVVDPVLTDDPLNPAVTDSGEVLVSVPDVEGTYTARYTVSDGTGTATATITIIADDDAPLQPPIARDDPAADDDPAVPPTRTGETADGRKYTEYNVVKNDNDPDGSRDALAVEVAAGQTIDQAPEVGVAERGWIRVVRTDQPQWVVYNAVDADGLAASAVILVDSTTNRPPDCRDEDPLPEILVSAGEPASYDIADLVSDPDGHQVVMTGSTIRVVPGDGEAQQFPDDYDKFGYRVNPESVETSVTLEVDVKDKPTAADEASIEVTCYFVQPITRDNNPPVVQDATVQVEEQTPRQLTLNTAPYATDPDGDPLTFALASGESSQTQDGVTLSLSADGSVQLSTVDATVGAQPVFEFTVTDGKATSGEPERAKVRVQVIATTRPPPSVQSFDFVDVEQGNPVVTDVSAGAFDPFAAEEPMRYIEAVRVEGSGNVTLEGSTVTFVPDPTFFGRAVVRFTAVDGAEREVTGTVTYAVIGRPLVPGQPSVTEVSSHRVVLSWAAADPQGTPITSYAVRWPGGSFNTNGATSATIDGLTNGVTVAFTVAAVNKVGEGPISVASNGVVPDEVPSKPQAPVIDPNFGNQELTVRWEAPAVDGTPIVEYTLAISSGQSITLPASTRQYTWTGLTNGTPYSFAVTARNSLGASERSDFSASLSPATSPSAAAAPVAIDASSAIECRVSLSWVRPADNGRPITGYRVRMNGATIFEFVTSPATSQSIPLSDTQCRQGNRFEVMAINVVGPSPWSAQSNAVNNVRAAGEPSVTGATRGDGSMSFTVSAPSALGGCTAISRYDYSLNGGGWTPLPGSPGPSSYTLAPLINGNTYSVRVRTINCSSFPSDASNTSPSVVPSGPPIAANIFVTGSLGGNNINWSWNATNAANGSPITNVSVSGSWTNGSVAASGSSGAVSYGCGQSHSITVTVTNANGTSANSSGVYNTSPCGQTVNTNTGTCLEPALDGDDRYNAGPPATCGGSTAGFFNGSLLVTCRSNWAWDNGRRWLRISGGTWDGWWVQDSTVTENTDGLPAC